jgi:hypothetical protein
MFGAPRDSLIYTKLILIKRETDWDSNQSVSSIAIKTSIIFFGSKYWKQEVFFLLPNGRIVPRGPGACRVTQKLSPFIKTLVGGYDHGSMLVHI